MTDPASFKYGILRFSMRDTRLEEDLFARGYVEMTEQHAAAAVLGIGLCSREPYPVRPMTDGALLVVFIYLERTRPLARIQVGLVDRTSETEPETSMEQRQKALCEALKDPEQCNVLARGNALS